MKLNELNAAIEKYHSNVGKMRRAMSGVLGSRIKALTGYDLSKSTQIAALEKYLQANFPATVTNPDVSLVDFEKAHGELSKKFLNSGSESAKLFINWIANDARLEEKQSYTSMQLIPTGENAFALPVLGVKSDSRNLIGTVCRFIAAQNGDVISFTHFQIDQSHPLYQSTQLRIDPAPTSLADSQLVLGAFNVLLLMMVKPNVVFSLPRAGLQINVVSLTIKALKFKSSLTHPAFRKVLESEPLSLPASVATQNRASSFGDFNLDTIYREPLSFDQYHSTLFTEGKGLPCRPADGESELFAYELLSDFEYTEQGSNSDDELSDQELSRFRI